MKIEQMCAMMKGEMWNGKEERYDIRGRFAGGEEAGDFVGCG